MSHSKPDIKTIFAEALARDESDRDAYLNEACGSDSGLRHRVEVLLRSHRQAGAFLEDAAESFASTGVTPASRGARRSAEGPGATVGPYRLREQIGEGGFGIVYLAEQVEPVKRRVALKIIKPGMDTQQVIARFEAERQALALMDHPGIARVFDGGSTVSGRPYFVMELVKGVTITQYCDACRLTSRERLELFLKVSEAVRHAHQKGVIHRDIKPSNVLVSMQDGRPVTKIIDFGVAKAVNQRLTEQTLHTAYAQLLGTPAYMSPEQAELSALDVDTRSDIYSLGVLLYELLTGTTPLEKRRFQQMSFDELRQTIREEEPPHPSARLSTLGAHATTVAAKRRTDPVELRQTLRGDLDWITMTCLEKDRARRYETAGDLVRELQRYLEDQPVAARPPSAPYRFRKFARRNRGPLTATALIITVLLAGMAGSLWQAFRARRAEELARQRLRAEQAARHDATEAVNDYFTLVSQNARLQQPELRPLRRDLLERALHFYRRFLREHGADPTLRSEAAATNFRIAILTYELGTGEDWLPWFEQGVTLVEDLLHDNADLTEMPCLESGQQWVGAAASLRVGHRREASRVLTHACRVWEELVDTYPDKPGFQNDLAAFYNGLAIFQDHDALRESEALYARAAELWSALVERHPDNARYRAGLAQSLSCRGAELVRLNHLPQAQSCIERALKIARRLAEESALPAAREFLGMMYRELAYLREDMGRFEEAAQVWQQAVTLQDALLTQYPHAARYRWGAFRDHLALAEVLWTLDRPDKAADHFAAAEALAPQLDPQNPQARNLLAWNLANCADPAFRDPQRAVQISRELVEQTPKIGDYWLPLGMGLYRQGDHQAAIAALEKVVTRQSYLDVCVAQFFLAMSHWKHDNAQQARACYQRGVEQMLNREYHCAEARRARCEAAGLMGIPLDDTAALSAAWSPLDQQTSHQTRQ